MFGLCLDATPQLHDSRGMVIVPRTDVTFSDDSSGSRRRNLLKGKGGGGGART